MVGRPTRRSPPALSALRAKRSPAARRSPGNGSEARPVGETRSRLRCRTRATRPRGTPAANLICRRPPAAVPPKREYASGRISRPPQARPPLSLRRGSTRRDGTHGRPTAARPPLSLRRGSTRRYGPHGRGTKAPNALPARRPARRCPSEEGVRGGRQNQTDSASPPVAVPPKREYATGRNSRATPPPPARRCPSEEGVRGGTDRTVDERRHGSPLAKCWVIGTRVGVTRASGERDGVGENPPPARTARPGGRAP